MKNCFFFLFFLLLLLFFSFFLLLFWFICSWCILLVSWWNKHELINFTLFSAKNIYLNYVLLCIHVSIPCLFEGYYAITKFYSFLWFMEQLHYISQDLSQRLNLKQLLWVIYIITLLDYHFWQYFVTIIQALNTLIMLVSPRNAPWFWTWTKPASNFASFMKIYNLNGLLWHHSYSFTHQ